MQFFLSKISALLKIINKEGNGKLFKLQYKYVIIALQFLRRLLSTFVVGDNIYVPI